MGNEDKTIETMSMNHTVDYCYVQSQPLKVRIVFLLNPNQTAIRGLLFLRNHM